MGMEANMEGRYGGPGKGCQSARVPECQPECLSECLKNATDRQGAPSLMLPTPVDVLPHVPNRPLLRSFFSQFSYQRQRRPRATHCIARPVAVLYLQATGCNLPVVRADATPAD